MDHRRGLPAALQLARNRAASEHFHLTGHGLAAHMVEMFMIAADTGRYLGRLCLYKDCPKPGKFECLVAGCGVKHLKHDGDFTFDPTALAPDRSSVLFDRQATAGEPTDCEGASP